MLRFTARLFAFVLSFNILYKPYIYACINRGSKHSNVPSEGDGYNYDSTRFDVERLSNGRRIEMKSCL